MLLSLLLLFVLPLIMMMPHTGACRIKMTSYLQLKTVWSNDTWSVIVQLYVCETNFLGFCCLLRVFVKMCAMISLCWFNPSLCMFCFVLFSRSGLDLKSQQLLRSVWSSWRMNVGRYSSAAACQVDTVSVLCSCVAVSRRMWRSCFSGWDVLLKELTALQFMACTTHYVSQASP